MMQEHTLRKLRLLAPVIMIAGAGIAQAQPDESERMVHPPVDLTARDKSWDGGEKITLTWKLAEGDPDNVSFYRVYRSLTVAPLHVRELHDAVSDLHDDFEELDIPRDQLQQCIENVLQLMDVQGIDDHADLYEYTRELRHARLSMERWIQATSPTNAETARIQIIRDLDKLDDAIPTYEAQREDDDSETSAEKIAMMAVTEPVLQEIFGDDWKEDWEERIEEIPQDVRFQLLEDRDQAEEQAEAQVARDVAALGNQRRYKSIEDVKPEEWELHRGKMSYEVEKLDRREKYWFKVTAVYVEEMQDVGEGAIPREYESEPAMTVAGVQPARQWFDGVRFPLSLYVLIVCGAVMIYIQIARSGKILKVRTIAGLEAVDEAVGRATEMGRPIMFICGIQDMNDIQTIAGLTVLSRVAKTAAEYDAKIEVPTSRSLVMTAARETVQAAYLEAGRPDAYNEDLIYYVTDEQFGFVAYLQGTMAREKPAACFYMGTFFAESLILAETGNSIGAIQVAGTAMPAQLPFFVAACDYTLIGEEFFAASAYLSGAPEQMGSLKGQDIGKMVVGIMVIIGVAVATLASVTGSVHLNEAVEFIRETMLR